MHGEDIMAYFEWGPRYEIGVEVVDYQHRRLVQLINDLHDTLHKRNFKEGLMEVIFEELQQYARYHFSVEEKLMEKVSYVNFSDHRLQHGAFVKRLEELKKTAQHESVVNEQLLQFLKDWLQNHILKEDMNIANYICHREGMV